MAGARDYALALFSLTEELGTTSVALGDVLACRDALNENPSYISLCDTPALSVPEKLSLIKSAFGCVDESVRNLLCILCEHHSINMFREIAKEYIALYNEARGIIEAEAITAIPLSAAQLAAIKKKLEAITGKTVTVNNTIDKAILSGIKLRYMGIQLDGSLKARLTQIEKSLQNTLL